MAKKELTRARRATKVRAKISRLKVVRLAVHRTAQHIYAQVISEDGQHIMASASSLDKDLRNMVKHGGNVAAAIEVGKKVAERAKQAGVSKVAFDRSGFKYHGRIKALADAARENGLVF